MRVVELDVVISVLRSLRDKYRRDRDKLLLEGNDCLADIYEAMSDAVDVAIKNILKTVIK